MVEVIEPTGAVSTLFLLAGMQSFVAEVDADANPEEGGTVDFFVDGAAVHLFDAATEQAIF